MFKVILDTNIIISAAHNPAGKPALVLSIALSQETELVSMYISKEVWEEYQEVITRDKFQNNQRNLKSFYRNEKQARMVKPAVTVSVIKIDPADNRILECASAAAADYLVTENIKHFPFKKFQNTRIVSPQEFLLILGEVVLS